MTQNNFTASVSGNFATPGNWSLGHVPNDTEDAEIDPANGVFAVESNTELVNSIGTFPADGLVIDDGASLTALNGTGPNVNDGSISIVDAFLFLGNGTFDNVGTVALNGVESSDVGTLDVEGSITLDGGGNIEASIGAEGQAGPSDNIIGGFNFSTTPTLINMDNTISGDVTIGGLNFTNDGSIQTNNSSSTNGGYIAIQGSTAGGSFINNSGILINSGGAILFGENNKASTIDNEGTIVFQANLKFTQLFVTGNLTISASGFGGRIEMEGQTPNDNEIDDLGEPTQLNLINQTLDGAGMIGIGDNTLTFNLESGTIEADVDNQVILINTGSNSITNGGTLKAILGGDLVIDSPINNLGTINVSGAGSIVDLFGAVTGGGAVDIGQNGILVTNTTISGNVTFTGNGAELGISNSLANGGIGGELVGATISDSIDFSKISFAAGNHLHWQQTTAGGGLLSVVNSAGATLASVTLAGSFTTSDFAASTATDGGTLATIAGLLSAPAPDDFNANRISDVLWRNSSDNSLATWLMNGSTIASSASVTSGGSTVAPDSSWNVAGIGDFNGDGDADILWRQSTTGSLAAWLMNGSTITSSASVTSGGSVVTPDSTWSVAGTGDFNGDGDADILWRQSTTGSLAAWLMNGATITSSAGVTSGGSAVTPNSTWSVAGTGDFNGDGNTDILWRQSTTGSLSTWLMNGATITSGASVTSGGNPVTPDSTWSIVGVGDFNGDGKADILWRQSTTGSLSEWLMNGATIASSASVTSGANPVTPDSTWTIVEVGDFNGTSQAGILWQQSTTGLLSEWQMNGAQIVSSQIVTAGGTPVAPASSWQVQAKPTDFV